MFRVEDIKKGEVSVLSLKEVCESYEGKIYKPLLASGILRYIIVRDETAGTKEFITRMEKDEKE